MGKEFITIKDGYFYNLPNNPNEAPKKYAETAYGKGEPVLGNLVYIRYKNSFTPMIKLDKGVTSTFRYIMADNVQPKTSSSFTNEDTVLDLQSNMIDNDLSCHRGDLRSSSFNGGAMEVFNGGDSAADGGDSFSNFRFLGIGKPSDKQIAKTSKPTPVDNKVEYSPTEVKTLQAKSGSKVPLKEWIKSDSAKTTLSNLGLFGASLLGGLGVGQSVPQQQEDTQSPNTPDDGEKKILGMHPLTFGVVAVSAVVLGVIGFVLMRKKPVVAVK